MAERVADVTTTTACGRNSVGRECGYRGVLRIGAWVWARIDVWALDVWSGMGVPGSANGGTLGRGSDRSSARVSHALLQLCIRGSSVFRCGNCGGMASALAGCHLCPGIGSCHSGDATDLRLHFSGQWRMAQHVGGSGRIRMVVVQICPGSHTCSCSDAADLDGGAPVRSVGRIRHVGACEG